MNVIVAPVQVVEQFIATAARQPAAVALEERPGASVTYGALAGEVEAVAARLYAAGLRPGESVLFSVPPSIASITLILAVMRVGATIVAADPRMGAAVFESRMALAQPAWAMAEARAFAAGASALGRAALRWQGVELPDLGRAAASHVRVGRWLPGAPRKHSFTDLKRAGLVPPPCAPQPGQQPALVIFTSGTTAAPKGVVHTNASVGAAMTMLMSHSDLDPDDVVYSNALYLNLPALMTGARSVIARHRRFEPTRWLADVESSGATVTFGIPSEMLGVADRLIAHGEQLPTSLRRVMFGSAPVYRSFLERLRPAVPRSTRVWSIYAMSEMLPVCAVEMGEKLEAGGAGDVVGRPLPGVRTRLAPDGELLLSGPNLFRGYLGGPPVTEHASGDLATMDTDGTVRLLGRKKEMLIRGHDNIYPSLVEGVVGAIPGVRRSVLCGYYDEAIEEDRVFLVVEPMPGEQPQALVKYVEREIRVGSHRLDAGALPDEVLAMTLPVSARSGKIDRLQVVAKLREERS